MATRSSSGLPVASQFFRGRSRDGIDRSTDSNRRINDALHHMPFRPPARWSKTVKVASRRTPTVVVGEVLFDLRGHGYKVISPHRHPGEAGASRICVIQIVPIDDDSAYDAKGFTSRQRQIAGLLANRATNAEVAATLGISIHTARHHSQRVLERLGVTSRAAVRAQLVRMVCGDLDAPNTDRRDR